MSRYIPPHLRGKPDNTENLAARRLSELKIDEHQISQLPQSHTLEELNCYFGTNSTHSTLRNTAKNPDNLGYVILFQGANPRWNDDHILFAHTNIHLLPGYDNFKHHMESSNEVEQLGSLEPHQGELIGKDEARHIILSDAHSSSLNEPTNTKTDMHSDKAKPVNSAEDFQIKNLDESIEAIPVFMESKRRRVKGGRNLVFHGYYRLASVEFLKPHSTELVRMLQQKWEPVHRNPNAPPPRGKERDPARWAKSLREEWAVVQFDPVPQDEAPAAPEIEILPEEEHFTTESWKRNTNGSNNAAEDIEFVEQDVQENNEEVI